MATELELLIGRASGASKVKLVRRIATLWGGYGQLWRVELTLPSGPTAAIVKHVQPPPGLRDRSHLRKLRSYAVEQAFYRRYAARCLKSPRCRVPRPLGLATEAGGWLFVLEDLGQSGFTERTTQPSDADITATLRWLSRFHARFLGTAPAELWPTGSYWHLATRPDELARMGSSPLRRAAAEIDRRLESARFKTFVHGDAKLENVCFDHGSDVALVDFQYVGGGVGVKDVAYFLSSSVPPRACQARVPAYVDVYFRELEAALGAAGSRLDVSALEAEWRALFPLAWVDYYRFLLGWAPGQLAREPYSELLVEQVLESGVTSA